MEKSTIESQDSAVRLEGDNFAAASVVPPLEAAGVGLDVIYEEPKAGFRADFSIGSKIQLNIGHLAQIEGGVLAIPSSGFPAGSLTNLEAIGGSAITLGLHKAELNLPICFTESVGNIALIRLWSSNATEHGLTVGSSAELEAAPELKLAGEAAEAAAAAE